MKETYIQEWTHNGCRLIEINVEVGFGADTFLKGDYEVANAIKDAYTGVL